MSYKVRKSIYGFSMTSVNWRDEMNRLMQVLYIVDNNAPGSIGGGGKPRQPLGLPFMTRQPEQE